MHFICWAVYQSCLQHAPHACRGLAPGAGSVLTALRKRKLDHQLVSED
jgi:hypothetical protein